MSHELRWDEGVPGKPRHSYWYCTCTVSRGGQGPGWVLFQSQPRNGGTAKPAQEGAQLLHRQHVEREQQDEEEWW